jgi:hypothetical protein
LTLLSSAPSDGSYSRRLSGVGFLADTNVGDYEQAKQAVEAAARSLGMQLVWK